MSSNTKDAASEQDDIVDQDKEAVNKMDSSGAPAEGVDVPEEFQKAVHGITHKATKAHISHIRSKLNQREDDMRAEEMKSKGKDGKMSMDNAPSSVGEPY